MINAQHAHIYRIHIFLFIFGEIFYQYSPEFKPFQPPPPHLLVDCCAVEVGNWAVQYNSPARSQIATSILPPPPQKKLTKIPLK